MFYGYRDAEMFFFLLLKSVEILRVRDQGECRHETFEQEPVLAKVRARIYKPFKEKESIPSLAVRYDDNIVVLARQAT
jgi:hypothetical protein